MTFKKQKAVCKIRLDDFYRKAALFYVFDMTPDRPMCVLHFFFLGLFGNVNLKVE